MLQIINSFRQLFPMGVFTLMTYNIERGFHNDRHVYQEQYARAAQRAVAAINPDLLALTEACYGGDNERRIYMQYDKIFNFPYQQWGGYRVFGPKGGDFGGNCLLSRFPLLGEVFQGTHKGSVRGLVDLEGKLILIDVVHPSYSIDDELKIQELQPLVKGQTDSYLLTGDFNTVHPADVIDYQQLSSDMAQYDPVRVQWLFDNWKQAKCISWILEQGLLDAFPSHARQSTVPTPRAYGTPQKGVRLDFTFHTPDIKIKEAYVFKNKDTDIASDHYPIVTVFEI